MDDGVDRFILGLVRPSLSMVAPPDLEDPEQLRGPLSPYPQEWDSKKERIK